MKGARALFELPCRKRSSGSLLLSWTGFLHLPVEEEISCASLVETCVGNYACYGYEGFQEISPDSSPPCRQRDAVKNPSSLDQFHDILAELRESKLERLQTPEDKLMRYQALVSLENDFLRQAEAYGKTILSELVSEEKTVRTKDGGILGGQKYVVNGILFKLAVDRSRMFGDSDSAGYDGAAKVAALELKCLASVMEAGVDIRVPLMALISYCGMTLIAMTLLPIKGRDTLVYGSDDGGKSFRFGEARSMQLCQQLGEKLNLKRHAPSGLDGDVSIRTPVDFEVHRSDVDGHYYGLDFSRFFPPTPPSKRVAGSIFQRQFRPEFVRAYGKPLCSDVFSKFEHEKTRVLSKSEAVEAMSYLENVLIPRLSQELSARGIPLSKK